MSEVKFIPNNDSNKYVDKIITNTQSNVIEITEDKLENILLKHLDKLNKSKAWITPLTLFITIILVLCTSNFINFIGIDAGVWKGMFIIGAVATGIWTLQAAINAEEHQETATIEYLINEIKNNTKPKD